jgi:G:T/U-mismatch repair DNA glycosylase
MTMLREIEKAAGITDRAAFWEPFAKLDREGGFEMHNGRPVSPGFKAGVRELQRRARKTGPHIIGAREQDAAKADRNPEGGQP